MEEKPRQISKVLREPSYLVRAVRAPIQTFTHTEEMGAIVLLAAAAVALGWANSPWSDSYFNFWRIDISFDIHIFAISEDLEHLVNEGLMAVFFFVVGLEIKRELLHGELSSFRKAALPVVAAAGGMAIPALIYLLFNPSGDGAAGWGVPVATDIAFALGVLALLGRRIPSELRVFLLGLAVVGDLGAIAIIATFYAETINWANLGLGLTTFVAIVACMRMGVSSLGFYLILCIVMWQFFLESGIHATLAGVLVAAVIPSEPYLRRRDYAVAVDDLLHDFRLAMANDDEEKAQTIVQQIEMLSRGTEGPMERLESVVHPWVSFVVLPVFALANAGIVFTSEMLSEAGGSPVTLGVAVALLVGNPLGTLGTTWLAVRLGIGQLPSTVTWKHVLGTGFLAGIGFTVSIFVAGIAFDDPALADQAKIGIFGASLTAGVVGYLFLRLVGARGS
ncbi:MAG: Na+/H+ antiporter NhaA [Chloroflexota bacterium]|nr:Na+/H+ antiporter NhaA [Chloroflexota bacterium]MDE2883790.1 Na+/H+ antiporter NhaA [Chloroflexota bacterium]